MERDEILRLLTLLGRRLDDRELQGEMYIVGGAAMALAFDKRRSTRDIDAVFEPKVAIYEEAAEMARELGLPPGWLNDAVKGSLAPKTLRRLRCWMFPDCVVWPHRRGCFLL